MGILEKTSGHESIRKALLQSLVRETLPSQLLFVGPEGIGKKRIAWGLAEILLCEQLHKKSSTDSTNEVIAVPNLQACETCSSCLKIQSGFHENILYIEPEKNMIKLERAQEIQDFLSLAQDRGARIIIINDVHCLNAQASNSLLKVLEEPPAGTYFFFITHRWTQVLPTIRSRATKVSFSPLSAQDLTPWCDPQQDSELIKLSRGSVKELLNQKQEDQILLRQEALLMLQKFFKETDFFLLGPWRDEIKDKDKLILFIRYWMFYLRDFFYSKTQAASEHPLFSSLSVFSEEQLWSFWDRGLTLEAGVLAHRDPVLLLEEWLIPLLEKKER